MTAQTCLTSRPGERRRHPPTIDPAAATTRRALLGLLVTAGAAAAIARETGQGMGAAVLPGPSTLDPGTALHVEVTGVVRGLDRAPASAGHDAHPGRSGGPAAGTPGDSSAAADGLGDRAWSRAVLVEILVHNTADREMLFSPGQVRLRLADGTGVMPADSQRGAGPLRARSWTRTWMHYLAPDDGAAITVDYTPAGATDAVVLPLGHLPHQRGQAR